jgi:hypothetical protein
LTTIGGTSDEKSLSDRSPANVPIRLIDACAPVHATSVKPEWRGRRNAGLPAFRTSLNSDVLSRISESRNV